MVFEISSTALHFLVKELELLKTAKVEKIYQIENTFLFKFHTTNGKKTLRITTPGIINLTTQEYKAPMNPPGFCMFLRKYLTNTRLVSIEQKEFERILLMRFSTKTEEYVFIAELFKPGNLILCKEQTLEEYEKENKPKKTKDAEQSLKKESPKKELIVINALQRQRFKDREIWTKKPYSFPPLLENPLKVNENELLQTINNSDRNLVKTLASKYGLGGAYSEEILRLTKVNKEAEKITPEESKEIVNAIKKFFSQTLYPRIEKEQILLTTTNNEKTISEAIDSLTTVQETKEPSAKSSKKKDKTQNLVEIQEKMIRNLEKSIQENQEKAEFVYAHYQEFQKLINKANKIRKEKGLDALEQEMKKNPKFKSINKKDKEIILEF